MMAFGIFVVAMTGAQLSIALYPPAGGYFLLIAVIGFMLTVIVLALAYLATPHRLGRLFVYF